MPGPDTHTTETMDRKTSRSICDAVGERLQQSLKPHLMNRAPALERLIEDMKRRETEPAADRRSQGHATQLFL